MCWKVGMSLTVPSKSHPSCCYFVSNYFATFSSQDKGILNIEQENSVYSIHFLQGHDLNETRFTLVLNIVNESCVVRKASYYPGQSQGSFHQKYNNLTITFFFTLLLLLLANILAPFSRPIEATRFLDITAGCSD